jgi:hypothetical protein
MQPSCAASPSLWVRLAFRGLVKSRDESIGDAFRCGPRADRPSCMASRCLPMRMIPPEASSLQLRDEGRLFGVSASRALQRGQSPSLVSVHGTRSAPRSRIARMTRRGAHRNSSDASAVSTVHDRSRRWSSVTTSSWRPPSMNCALSSEPSTTSGLRTWTSASTSTPTTNWTWLAGRSSTLSTESGTQTRSCGASSGSPGRGQRTTLRVASSEYR